MFALVIFICYLQGHCDDFVIEILATEEECLAVMDEQHIRRGGCYPLDEVHDNLWSPAQEYVDIESSDTPFTMRSRAIYLDMQIK